MKVSENIQHINENIQRACERSGRRMEDVHVVAVTKYVSIDRAEEAVEAGLLHLGENRDEGLTSKWDVLRDKARWHFIGSLQSRKVKNIIDKVSYIHSLDRLSLAKEIHKRADKPVSCFVQVNVSGEESKHGISPDEVKEFVGSLKDLSNIKVVGLMTMAPHTDDEPFLRSCFRQLKTIQEEIRSLNLPYAPCTELSMGMSNDYVIAIEEGATFIRIGTALVGND
ncbi:MULTISPECIES: YggS family pyridoxal phosphate-dependent enzyme [Rossellomorea]|uniref:YggS family pyridoxal phosphate-dependent enzyme n=1 Tax=Rossellomorea TaxID=2837508 RepID=UPI0005551883|nr:MULTISPECIES: YggS family pyridoxal phosphate-dependent enzyme [Rossellomorea]MCC5802692.1 YggS family pyridoxal phosphate-dependent enzyme [Rossellomorea vietnamensis]UTE75321.1 YggS family pyridoxal phosphate-dependent enzyme [Rossellomorea sp. KS-H15a]WGG47445.1 YggS family pyridoxal phosphate-dependent enzyme [Rossellomorea sp. DA94]